MTLANKRILFIGPCFHDYHQLITNQLTEFGAVVDFYPERSYGWIYKFTNVFFNHNLADYQKLHYDNILNKIKDIRYDILYVIRGFMLPCEFVLSFSEMNPNARKIMYQWDSNKTNPFFNIISLFDDVYSFDYEDCDLRKELIYVPLFYSFDISDFTSNKSKFDLFCVGVYLPERYAALKALKLILQLSTLSLKVFIYIPLTSLIKEYIKGNFKWDYSMLSIKHMSKGCYLKLLNDSKAVVDVSNLNQTGLAIRIIEAIALKKKIITSNVNIKKEPLMNDSLVYILDIQHVDLDDLTSFLNSPIESSFNPMSLLEWLQKQFKC